MTELLERAGDHLVRSADHLAEMVAALEEAGISEADRERIDEAIVKLTDVVWRAAEVVEARSRLRLIPGGVS